MHSPHTDMRVPNLGTIIRIKITAQRVMERKYITDHIKRPGAMQIN